MAGSSQYAPAPAARNPYAPVTSPAPEASASPPQSKPAPAASKYRMSC